VSLSLKNTLSYKTAKLYDGAIACRKEYEMLARGKFAHLRTLLGLLPGASGGAFGRHSTDDPCDGVRNALIRLGYVLQMKVEDLFSLQER
jgi:hypothetical protein